MVSSALPTNAVTEDEGENDDGQLASAGTTAPIGHRFHANHDDDSQVLHDVPDGAAQSANGRGIRAHDAITGTLLYSCFLNQ